jgi:hypothetical protein
VQGAIVKHKIFFGSAGALPSRKTIRYSPFATRCRFNIRQSLFAAVSRLVDLPISRFADKIRLGRNFALPRFSLLMGGSLCRDDCQPFKSMGLQNERWLKPDLLAKLCRSSTSNDDLSAFKDFLRPFMSNGFKEGSHQRGGSEGDDVDGFFEDGFEETLRQTARC